MKKIERSKEKNSRFPMCDGCFSLSPLACQKKEESWLEMWRWDEDLAKKRCVKGDWIQTKRQFNRCKSSEEIAIKILGSRMRFWGLDWRQGKNKERGGLKWEEKQTRNAVGKWSPTKKRVFSNWVVWNIRCSCFPPHPVILRLCYVATFSTLHLMKLLSSTNLIRVNHTCQLSRRMDHYTRRFSPANNLERGHPV